MRATCRFTGLFVALPLALASPSLAQSGEAVVRQTQGRVVLVRDWVGPDQYPITAGGRIAIQDYGFSALLPEQGKVTIGDSGGHVHGFGVGPISIWADYNVLDHADALASLTAFPETCGAAKAGWAKGKWSRAIDGQPTATCREDGIGGVIRIVFVAMAGDGGASPPTISYRITLDTTEANLGEDLSGLRTFVCSVRVRGGTGTSPLCAGRFS